MRPKFLTKVIGGALLVLLAAWSLAPKAPVTNQPQPQPVTTVRLQVPRNARPMHIAATAPVLTEVGFSSETTVVTNDVPEGYKRIRLTIVGAGFATRPSNNSVQ